MGVCVWFELVRVGGFMWSELRIRRGRLSHPLYHVSELIHQQILWAFQSSFSEIFAQVLIVSL